MKVFLPLLLAISSIGLIHAGQPNIILYMVDDLGWNHISATEVTMGTHGSQYRTPHLEQLAREGLSFTHAYAQPNCAPTRAAMLSGQYPARIHNDVYVVQSLSRFSRGKGKAKGITKEKAKFIPQKQTEDVAPEAITIAEALKKNGYATAHIGKYHVGGHEGDSTMPENVGFDINIGGFSQGHQPTCFSKESGHSPKSDSDISTAGRLPMTKAMSRSMDFRSHSSDLPSISAMPLAMLSMKRSLS